LFPLSLAEVVAAVLVLTVVAVSAVQNFTFD